jgi:hypothetical protein
MEGLGGAENQLICRIDELMSEIIEFEGIIRQHDRPVSAKPYRLLEFHPFMPTEFTDITLYANHHVFFKQAIVGTPFFVFTIPDQRILDPEATAMGDISVAIRDTVVRQLVGFIGVLEKSHSNLQ